MAKLVEVVNAIAHLHGVVSVNEVEEMEDGGVLVYINIASNEAGWWSLSSLSGMIHIGCDCPDERHPDYHAGMDFPPATSVLFFGINEDGTVEFRVDLEPGIDLDECLRNLTEDTDSGCSICDADPMDEIEAFLSSVDGTP